jgi:hypothetical protein
LEIVVRASGAGHFLFAGDAVSPALAVADII